MLLSLCLIVFVIGSWHWPEVNDPAQISYLAWLMDHGFRPYLDLIEMNMPGAYMTNWGVLHLFGISSLAWRVFDLGLAAASGIAIFMIARPFDRFAGVLAGATYILFHAHDGPAEMGQRDYIISVLLLLAYAFLFESDRRKKPWLLFLFGFCASASATFKPQAIILGLFLLAVYCWYLHRQKRSVTSTIAFSFVGMIVPFVAVLVFLLREHAVFAFWHTMKVMLPYYAILDRRTPMVLLRRTIVPSIGTILVLGAVAGWAQRKSWNWERLLLLAGIGFGAFSEIVQGKGWIYHRYPITAFILLSACIELVLAARRQGWLRAVGYAGILYAALSAVLYTTHSTRVFWDEAYNTGLTADLNSLGGPALSGQVQCFALGPDCATTLYRLRLVQATGLVYDYTIFSKLHNIAVTDSQNRFWIQLLAHRPRVIVLGRWLYPETGDDYSKLDRWPKFRDYLNAHYTLYTDRNYPRALGAIRGYRIYVLKPGM